MISIVCLIVYIISFLMCVGIFGWVLKGFITTPNSKEAPNWYGAILLIILFIVMCIVGCEIFDILIEII